MASASNSLQKYLKLLPDDRSHRHGRGRKKDGRLPLSSIKFEPFSSLYFRALSFALEDYHNPSIKDPLQQNLYRLGLLYASSQLTDNQRIKLWSKENDLSITYNHNPSKKGKKKFLSLNFDLFTCIFGFLELNDLMKQCIFTCKQFYTVICQLKFWVNYPLTIEIRRFLTISFFKFFFQQNQLIQKCKKLILTVPPALTRQIDEAVTPQMVKQRAEYKEQMKAIEERLEELQGRHREFVEDCQVIRKGISRVQTRISIISRYHGSGGTGIPPEILEMNERDEMERIAIANELKENENDHHTNEIEIARLLPSLPNDLESLYDCLDVYNDQKSELNAENKRRSREMAKRRKQLRQLAIEQNRLVRPRLKKSELIGWVQLINRMMKKNHSSFFESVEEIVIDIQSTDTYPYLSTLESVHRTDPSPSSTSSSSPSSVPSSSSSSSKDLTGPNRLVELNPLGLFFSCFKNIQSVKIRLSENTYIHQIFIDALLRIKKRNYNVIEEREKQKRDRQKRVNRERRAEHDRQRSVDAKRDRGGGGGGGVGGSVGRIRTDSSVSEKKIAESRSVSRSQGNGRHPSMPPITSRVTVQQPHSRVPTPNISVSKNSTSSAPSPMDVDRDEHDDDDDGDEKMQDREEKKEDDLHRKKRHHRKTPSKKTTRHDRSDEKRSSQAHRHHNNHSHENGPENDDNISVLSGRSEISETSTVNSANTDMGTEWNTTRVNTENEHTSSSSSHHHHHRHRHKSSKKKSHRDLESSTASAAARMAKQKSKKSMSSGHRTLETLIIDDPDSVGTYARVLNQHWKSLERIIVYSPNPVEVGYLKEHAFMKALFYKCLNLKSLYLPNMRISYDLFIQLLKRQKSFAKQLYGDDSPLHESGRKKIQRGKRKKNPSAMDIDGCGAGVNEDDADDAGMKLHTDAFLRDLVVRHISGLPGTIIEFQEDLFEITGFAWHIRSSVKSFPGLRFSKKDIGASYWHIFRS